VEGKNIVSRQGYDCPLSRDLTFKYAEQRGLGHASYHIIGGDTQSKSPLASVQGRLGTVSNGVFQDLFTHNLYYDVYKFPWDMQKTALAYFAAVDQLTGSTLKKDFLAAFDEDRDGIVGYDDFGRKGFWNALLHQGGRLVSLMGGDQAEQLRGAFLHNCRMLKFSNPAWNQDRHDLYQELSLGACCWIAMLISELGLEAPDPFLPSLTWGKGKWPGFSMAAFAYTGMALYGPQFPYQILPESLYGIALCFADLTQNQGRYAGPVRSKPEPQAAQKYFADLKEGKRKPLDFVFYVPPGFGKVAGAAVPNVEETDQPEKLFTAVFAGGREIWPVK
jgi:hypothetical protein